MSRGGVGITSNRNHGQRLQHSDPTRWPLVVRCNQFQRPLIGTERCPILFIRDNYIGVLKIGIQFGQCEHNTVSIAGPRNSCP